MQRKVAMNAYYKLSMSASIAVAMLFIFRHFEQLSTFRSTKHTTTFKSPVSRNQSQHLQQLEAISKAFETPESLLEPWEFITSEDAKRSILNNGDLHLFNEAFVEAIVKRRKLNIKLFGGSNSLPNGWWGFPKFIEVFIDYMQRIVAKNLKITIDFDNRGQNGRNSLLYATCHQNYVNLNETDILLVEEAINDGLTGIYGFPGFTPLGRPMEELIRAVKRTNPKIFIVLVNLAVPEILFNTSRSTLNCNHLDEQDYLDLARHYQLGSITWKRLYCDGGRRQHALLTQAQMQQLYDVYKHNAHHPNGMPHRHVAYFLLYYFRSMVKNLRHFKGKPKPWKVVGLEPKFYNATWMDFNMACGYSENAQFHFRFQDETKNIATYLPRIHVAYNTTWEPSYKPTLYRVDAVFTFSNLMILQKQFFFEVKINILHHQLVAPLVWGDVFGNDTSSDYQAVYSRQKFSELVGSSELFCLKDAKTLPIVSLIGLDLFITQISGNYPVLNQLLAMIVADECKQKGDQVLFK